MKKNLILFLKTYLLIILVFLIQKPLFMAYHHNVYSGASFTDWFSVMYHGFKLDISMAGYLTLLPGIFLIVSLWVKPQIMTPVKRFYFGLISALISIVFVSDIVLYKYWGFRLDCTPLFYLKQPKDAMASADWKTLVFGLLSMTVISYLLYRLFNRFLVRDIRPEKKLTQKLITGFVLLFTTGLLFFPIRGGVTVSTMCVGKVYYSQKMELNHAAINPMFNIFETLFLEQDFDKQFRFMDKAEAKKEFSQLVEKQSVEKQPELFTIQHPNIVIVVLESFMSKVIAPLGGIPDVAVRMNGFCNEGVLFTNFYANSFRTDRGLVSIYSGYPAQPTTSIMKYPAKTQTLPSIPKSLKKVGYDLQYYYGGDADFTNMKSYLISMGIDNIVCDKNFPIKDRMTKWGAPDHIVFNRISSDLDSEQKEPFLKMVQTLSSHEPFEVPYHKFNDMYLNSVAYTDSSLGVFIDRFKQTKYWKNSIVILVPDHAMHYPANIDNRSIARYKIPLLIIGGAVKTPCRIDTYASQIDISATLLEQMNIPHTDFMFSKNILNPASPHFGYFTFPKGFGMVSPENRYVYDCDAKSVVTQEGMTNYNKKKAEALLQTLYDDLEKR
ncbi:MAG: sulfatase-like hydrolase/transferase [Paludibacter sp.]